MFATIKSEVNLLETIERDTGLTFRQQGEAWVIEDDKETSGCPFCGHHDCFRIRHDDNDLSASIFKCFSCGDRPGDVIEWVYRFRKMESLKQAAEELAKEHGIPVQWGQNPIQEVFSLAAQYYERCLWETCDKPYVELGKRTPLQYQTEVRNHKEGTLKHFHVGWSDGGLIEYLSSVGIDSEVIAESGLESSKSGKDFLPAKCFIYPHYVRGKVSHFTFKDPLKRISYQLPKKKSLNGYTFYNQDAVANDSVVVVVEGENDLLSVFETGEAPAVIATIGSVSGAQLDWMRQNLSSKRILTIFDPDDAGDKYRAKVERNRAHFKGVIQVLPPEGKDIDDHLRAGAAFKDVVKSNITQVAPTSSSEVSPPSTPATGGGVLEISGIEWNPSSDESEGDTGIGDPCDEKPIQMGCIVQKKGCYWRVKTNSEGDPTWTKLSNCILRLNNVFLTEEGDRHREVVVIKENGYRSKPILVDSEAKVSVKPFRVLLAKAADADFRGRDDDLIDVWNIVFEQGTDSTVNVPRTVGRLEEYKGWVFRNVYVSDAQKCIDPDKDGIFWMPGKQVGIRPESMNQSHNGSEKNNSDIPFMETGVDLDETDALLGDFIENLTVNLGNRGAALLMTAWIYANVHSNFVFELHKGFPFLFFWGRHGRGKTTVARWLQDFFGMREFGYFAIPRMKSIVGLARSAEYYASMPLIVDEVRSDEQTRQYLGDFRSFYDRAHQTQGIQNSFGVRTRACRATFMFCGEDQFDDGATRERCIPVRIPVTGREEVTSFQWMENHRHLFTAISYKWINEANTLDYEELRERVRTLDKDLRAAGCSQRVSKNWAAIGVFGVMLAEKYCPDFNFTAHLVSECGVEAVKQEGDGAVNQFWDYVEQIQAQEGSRITAEHIQREGDNLYVWFSAIFKIVQDETRGRLQFSRNAILSAIREEPYFVRDNHRVQLGLKADVRRAVVVLSVSKATDILANIAGAAAVSASSSKANTS